MFGKFFSGKPQAVHADDHVWATHTARLRGITRETTRQIENGASIVVVARELATFDELETALAAYQPRQCRDTFSKEAVNFALRQPRTVVLALASALPSDQVEGTHPVIILVHGRYLRREQDEVIDRFADRIGKRARLVYHLSFADPLLASYAESIYFLLERMKSGEEEPVFSTLVTRAIAKAQAKNK